MKKITAILLVLLLAFSLAACGGDKQPNNDDPLNRDDPSTSQTQSGENNGDTSGAPDVDFNEIMGGATDTVWGKQDEATKQQIISEAKADGYDVTFGADGSMTLVNPTTGETVIQNSDGTWTFDDGEGSGQLGGSWPDNEFTKLIPNPGFDMLMTSTEGNDFTAAFSNTTVEQLREYTEKVKAAGFTIDAETMDEDAGGMVIYTYTAKNAQGYTIQISFAMGSSTVVIEKP